MKSNETVIDTKRHDVKTDIKTIQKATEYKRNRPNLK